MRFSSIPVLVASTLLWVVLQSHAAPVTERNSALWTRHGRPEARALTDSVTDVVALLTQVLDNVGKVLSAPGIHAILAGSPEELSKPAALVEGVVNSAHNVARGAALPSSTSSTSATPSTSSLPVVIAASPTGMIAPNTDRKPAGVPNSKPAPNAPVVGVVPRSSG